MRIKHLIKKYALPLIAGLVTTSVVLVASSPLQQAQPDYDVPTADEFPVDHAEPEVAPVLKVVPAQRKPRKEQ